MLELETELSSRDVNTDDNSNSGQSFNISMECDSSEEMERNLALLTAQYEKTSQDEDPLHFSPGHIMVNNSLDIDKPNDGEVMPPAMSLLNNSSDTVKLARELRHKRDQLEELMKKNVMTTSVNESNYAGRKMNNRAWCEVTNPGQELYKLGDQVNRLKEELERISQPVLSSGESQSQSQSQSSQLAQLSVSVNQLYSGLWSLQRDVSQISERLAAVESSERRASLPSSVSQAEPPQPPAWDSHQHFSPFPSSELWNSLQASPGFNNPLHMFPPSFPISETDSGVSSGALNNQPGVSPGVRANNYYDNFRSFSRQNRLAGSSQQSPQSSEPANNVNNGSVRPRRKYKINREHNKDSDQSNLRRRTEGANPVLAANTFTSPGTESLTNNIYSQVGALIQQHDRAPELLTRLLQDLTLLGQQESRNMNLDLDTSSLTSEETRDTTRESDNRHLQSRSKVAGKRLTSGPQSGFSPAAGWAPVWSPVAGPGPGPGAAAVPKNQQKNLTSRERDSRRVAGWRERVLPRNMQDREEGDQEGFINIQLELPEDSQEQEVSDQAETEELAEADQSHEMTHHRDIWAQHEESREQEEERDSRDIFQPEGVFPVRDSHNHQGLDRVPIRLPSTTANSTNWLGMSQAASERIEARRLEENEAVASILEEVLASSPELANNQEADTPHMP